MKSTENKRTVCKQMLMAQQQHQHQQEQKQQRFSRVEEFPRSNRSDSYSAKRVAGAFGGLRQLEPVAGNAHQERIKLST